MTKKRILMTGCGSGFGLPLYRRFQSQGHSVYGIGLNGPDMQVNFANIKTSNLKEWVEQTLCEVSHAMQWSHVDVLINNAGMAHCDWVEDYDLDTWDDILKVNLTTPFALTQGVLRYNYVLDGFEPQENSLELFEKTQIINTSSMGATIGLRGSPAYCASKAGLEALTKTLAKEFAGRYPITVVAVAPGGIDGTAMQAKVEQDLCRMRGMTSEQAAAYNRQSPLGRNMDHDELWAIYEFLVNEAPDYLTGTVIKCTGGMGV